MKRRVWMQRSGLGSAAAVLAATVAMVVPTGASAWKWIFQDFFAAQSGATGSAFAVAKKCKGGKLGFYKFESRAEGAGGDTEFQVEVTLDLPVFEKFKRFRDVDVEVRASQNFDPMIVNEILNAYTDFWEGGESRWEPGEITFRHPELVVFGNQILSQGVHKEDFKPKDRC